ncbi:MAG: MFS transporter [Proteobacteria bacterium]|nr:MFS transporter [Pseudomonadota bacterium]
MEQENKKEDIENSAENKEQPQADKEGVIDSDALKDLDKKPDKNSEALEALKSETEPGDEDEINEDAVDEPDTIGYAIKKGFMETIDTFRAFAHAPREIIGINIINVFEGMAYFGILTLLTLFMTKNVLVTDAPYVKISELKDVTQIGACFSWDNRGGCVNVHAGWIVSGFLMLITFSQLFLGGLSDKIGPKKMLGISIAILLGSRIVMGFSETLFASFGTGIGSLFFFVVAGCLLCAALAYGVFNPAVYSITRMYSDKKTSAVSYAMLYAGMNLGAFLIGLLLPHIRHVAGDELMGTDTFASGHVIASLKNMFPGFNPKIVLHEGLMPGTNGFSGALIFIAGIMVIVFLLYFFFIASSKTKPLTDPKEPEEGEDDPDKPKEKLSMREKISNHPLTDLKFDFFIFILIPVQTLFAYQNILIPTYLERCFQKYPTISDNFETFSNLNPLIVFLFAPVIAALTAKQDVYKMMIIGTTVMAIPTFLMGFGTTPLLFLTFILIGAIGESMWQPRFLQHVTQIAPKDRMGAYVGIANLPWFLTKFIVGLYVGFFMEDFIPDIKEHPELTQNPESMWFIFACIAMVTPVALFLARKWMNPKKTDKDKDSESVAA